MLAVPLLAERSTAVANQFWCDLCGAAFGLVSTGWIPSESVDSALPRHVVLIDVTKGSRKNNFTFLTASKCSSKREEFCAAEGADGETPHR